MYIDLFAFYLEFMYSNSTSYLLTDTHILEIVD